jgi:hypothetical protein
MDTNEPQAEQSQPQSDLSSGGGDGQKSWKTAAFIAVLVLAGAVAAHSVLTRNGGLCGVLPCGVGKTCGGGAMAQCDSTARTCPLNATCAMAEDCPKSATCPSAGGCCASECCCANQESCPLMSDGQGELPSGCPMAAPTGCCPASAPQ